MYYSTHAWKNVIYLFYTIQMVYHNSNSNSLLKNFWGMKQENINQFISDAATVQMYRIQLLYNNIVYNK